MVDGGDDTHILLRPVWIHVKGQGWLVSLELMYSISASETKLVCGITKKRRVLGN